LPIKLIALNAQLLSNWVSCWGRIDSDRITMTRHSLHLRLRTLITCRRRVRGTTLGDNNRLLLLLLLRGVLCARWGVHRLSLAVNGGRVGVG
jgi:hypothetical protein